MLIYSKHTLKQLAQISNLPIPENLKSFKFWGVAGQNASVNVDLIGQVVSRLITFAIIGAGLFFFVRLISAGYAYLTSLGEPAKIQSASKELLNAVIGLIIVISTFFVAQIIQVVFGINIL